MSPRVCKTFKNALDDDSLYIPAEIDPAEIPSPFRELVDDRHLAFLAAPREHINQLAALASIDSMRRWFEDMCTRDAYGLIVHRADFMGDGHIQSDLTICAPGGKRGWRYFRLPENSTAEFLPESLAALYQVTNGTIEEHDTFLTAGFNPMPLYALPDIESDSRQPCPPELANAPAFYRLSTGDQLLAVGEEAYSHHFPNGSTQHQGSIASLIESYFDCDINGGNWHPFQY